MSGELWMGIAIGSLGSWAFLIFILTTMHQGKRKASSSQAIANGLLKERNNIGHEQIRLMGDINASLETMCEILERKERSNERG